MDSEYVALNKAIDKLNSDIAMLEEEYSFLLKENTRGHYMGLAELLSKIVGDEGAPEVFGEKLTNEVRASSWEALDDVPVSRGQWLNSFTLMTDEIVILHLKQMKNYEKLKELCLAALDGEFLEQPFEKHAILDQYEKVIDSYQVMVNLYGANYNKLKGFTIKH